MKRLFVSEVDTLLGRKVCDLFAATKEYEITGTVRSDEQAYLLGHKQLPPHVSSITPSYRTGNVAFKAAVLHADAIVCLMRDDMIEAEAATKMLRNGHYEVEKTLVVVSSVMTWANTVASRKAEERAEREAERAARIAEGEDVDDEEVPHEAEEEEPIVLAESEYQGRVPHERYQHWKELEVLVKQSNSATLHTHVVFAGLQYGMGEQAFASAFRAAWHQQRVPMLTDGTNVVPTIHVQDLAQIIFKTASAEAEVDQRYILAVDRGNNTLGSIMHTIASKMGSGITEAFDEARHGVVPRSEHLSVDLRMDPSSAFDVLPEEEWVAPNGLVSSFDRVATEYREAHGLTPVRAMLIGPPRAGKTAVAKSLASTYRIPILDVQSIITSYEAYAAQLDQALRRHRDEKKRARLQVAFDLSEEEAREAREAAKAAAEDNEGGEDDDDQDANMNEDGEEEEEDDDAVSEIGFSNNGFHLVDEDGDGNGEADDTEEEGAEARVGPTAAEDEEDEEDSPDDEAVQLLLEQIQRAKEVLSLKMRDGLKPKVADEEADADAEAEEEELDEEGNPLPKPLPPGVRLRYVDEALAAMGKWRLQQKDCLNQGFLLEGFPKTVRQAQAMFHQEDVSLPTLEEIAERELEPLPPMDLDEASARVDARLLPDVCIHLYADDALLLGRVDDSTPHTSMATFVRRLRQYKANHDPTLLSDASLVTWVRSATTEEVEESTDNGLVPAVPARQMFYVEVNAGSMLSEESAAMATGYLKATLGERHFITPTVCELKAAACEAEHSAQLLAFQAQRAEEKRAEDERLAIERHQREVAVHERRYRSIAEEKKLAENITSMPMETYLAQFVLHPLSKGVENVIAMRPEDPVKALADFLFEFEPRKQL